LGGARDGSGPGSASAADKVVEEIRAAGGEAVASYDSVSSPEGAVAIVNKAIEAYGRLDILINNAGILRDKSLAKMEPDDWNAVMSVHLDGAYNVSRPAFLKMRENGYGRIVLTSSASGLYGNFGQTNYGAAKLALVGFMNTLKIEGEKHNIKVNTIAPTARTRLTEDVLPPDLADRLRPEFVAPLVLYLCSEQCPVNGAIYNAGMGYYNRAALMTGSGVRLGGGIEVPTPEEVAKNIDKICSLDSSIEYHDALSALGKLVEPGPAQPVSQPEVRKELTVKDIFDRMPESFRPDKAAGVDVVFQYRISGPGGGDWNVSVRNGACETAQGIHANPTTTILMSDQDFLSMMSGKLNAMQAYTSGKLKIEGDLMKSQLIQKLFKF
jgi:NAD(P)-dependent dehydrogenase (short-subunit alcohol dehydrogenase family)/putative sterol carrier protein